MRDCWKRIWDITSKYIRAYPKLREHSCKWVSNDTNTRAQTEMWEHRLTMWENRLTMWEHRSKCNSAVK